MSEHRYPSAVLYADYLRAGVGVLLTAAPLLLIELATGLDLLFAALAALFAWFGVRTGLRHASRVELSPEAIALRGPLERRLPWAQLDRVKLAYYAPRRARERGWLQLTLKGARGGAIRLDSTIEGFERVLDRVREQVDARDLPLDPATASNLGAVGLEPDASRAGAPSRPHSGVRG